MESRFEITKEKEGKKLVKVNKQKNWLKQNNYFNIDEKNETIKWQWS